MFWRKILILVIVVLLLGGLYALLPKPKGSVDTSTWQSYENDELGVTFKMPASWSVWYEGDVSTTVASVPKKTHHVHGVGIPASPGMWLEVLKKPCNTSQFGFDSYGPDYSYGPKEAFSKVRSRMTICKNDHLISLFLYNGEHNGASEEERKTVLGAIVESIEFKDIPGEQVYTNEDYGFELRYPADWKSVDTSTYGRDDTILYLKHELGPSVRIIEIPKATVDEYIQAEEQRMEDYKQFIRDANDAGYGVGVHQALGEIPVETIIAGRAAAVQRDLEALAYWGDIFAFPEEGFLIETQKEQSGEGEMTTSPEDIVNTITFTN